MPFTVQTYVCVGCKALNFEPNIVLATTLRIDQTVATRLYTCMYYGDIRVRTLLLLDYRNRYDSVQSTLPLALLKAQWPRLSKPLERGVLGALCLRY